MVIFLIGIVIARYKIFQTIYSIYCKFKKNTIVLMFSFIVLLRELNLKRVYYVLKFIRKYSIYVVNSYFFCLLLFSRLRLIT